MDGRQRIPGNLEKSPTEGDHGSISQQMRSREPVRVDRNFPRAEEHLGRESGRHRPEMLSSPGGSRVARA